MPELDDFDELIEELTLGSARGGRRPKTDVIIESIRPLEDCDVELLVNPPVVGAVPSVPQIRHQHHQLAGLIAKGLPNSEISLITGFSPSYISMLKSAPDMKELVQYYAEQAQERTIDALARLRGLGLASVEELQNRLNDAPEKFTAGQLMDMIEIGLIKPMEAQNVALAGKTAGNGIQINLNFKAPDAGTGAESLGSGPGAVIEGTVK